jgi:hypothetical protein
LPEDEWYVTRIFTTGKASSAQDLEAQPVESVKSSRAIAMKDREGVGDECCVQSAATG